MVLLPTVADCAHLVGMIMFEWGAMHLSRSSGVSHALFTGFQPDFDDATELKQNAPRYETAVKRLGAPRRAREPVCFDHNTLNAPREQL